MDRKSNKLEYFAATLDHVELANGMKEKVRQWTTYCSERGLIGLWEKKINNYYGNNGAGSTSQAVTAGGSEGELSMMKINDLRSLIQQQLILVTGQRPAGQARAINSNTKALKSSRIASALSEFYMSDALHDFESAFVTGTEIALLLDEAHLELEWDKSAGYEITVDQDVEKLIMTGDARLNVHCPWNVARDPSMKVADQKWKILSFKVNKFDYAAKYDKFSEEILSQSGDDIGGLALNRIEDGSDAIFVHLLVHDRTSAIPQGRYSLLIGDQIVLDTKLPFKDYPVERIAPSDVIEGPTGYAAANDILGMEELTDALHSIIASNEITFGGQNIAGPEGANLKVSDIAKGARYFELPADLIDKLRPLNFCHTPPEVFNYITMLGNKKDQTVGTNSVVRGQPEGQLSGASGSALALIQAQAISFNSGTQKGYFRLLSAVMTKLIGILQQYADSPMIAKIAGRSKSAALRQFKYTGRDLDGVSSIVYEIINPIAQTIGGRLTFAQDLLKAGQIKSPKQYINVATTGQIDELIQDDEADGMIILEENEWLAEGRPFDAVITQMHSDHIKSHTSQITLEAQEKDPQFVIRTTQHIQRHLDLWQQASVSNPGILMATGQQLLLPPPPPMGQVGLPPGAAASPGSPAAHAMPPQQQRPPQGIGKEIGGGMPAAVQKAQEVKQPQLPKVAGTRERAQVPGVTDSPLTA